MILSISVCLWNDTNTCTKPMSVHCIIPFPLLIFSLIKFVQSCMIDGQKLTCLADFNLFFYLISFHSVPSVLSLWYDCILLQGGGKILDKIDGDWKEDAFTTFASCFQDVKRFTGKCFYARFTRFIQNPACIEMICMNSQEAVKSQTCLKYCHHKWCLHGRLNIYQ